MFPESELRETLTFKGNIPRNFEAGNSLNLAVVAVVDQHWQVTVHCIPFDVIAFAILPA